MKISDILHYFGGGLLLLLGALEMFGIHFPGITVDPATAFLAGGAVFGIGHKADQALAGFLLPFAIAIALLTGGGTAFAADLQIVKASPRLAPRLVPFDSVPGYYYGASSYGATSKIDVPAVGTETSSNAMGGAVFGYAWGVPTNWFSLETGLYKSMTGGSAAPDAVWAVRSRVIWGGPVQKFLALIPAPATQPSAIPVLSPLPAGNQSPYPYVYAVGQGDNLGSTLGKSIQFAGGVGLGMRQKLDEQTAMDYFSDCTWSLGRVAIGGATQERKCVAGITVMH